MTKHQIKCITAADAVNYAGELGRIIDAVTAAITAANERGFRPSFIVKCGALVSVSAYPLRASDVATDNGEEGGVA